MYKHLLLFITLCSCINSFAQYKGTIAANDIPIKDVSVCNLNTGSCVTSDAQGNFSIAASNGDVIQFSHINFLIQQVTVNAARLAANSELITMKLIPIVQNAPQAPSSSWIGAKIGYNFDGFSDDDLDFIGSAKIKLNMIESNTAYADYGVIGNIADFISKTDKEDGDKDLQKLVLSVTGLNVGMYGEWFFKPGEKAGDRKRSNCSFYATTGYKLNTYKYVTDDSITVNLSQSKTSVGFQFEGLSFTEKESNLNLSAEASLYLFDPNRYEKIFHKKKSVLVSMEIGAIIPVKNKIGFFLSATFAPDVTGVFLAGLIIKP